MTCLEFHLRHCPVEAWTVIALTLILAVAAVVRERSARWPPPPDWPLRAVRVVVVGMAIVLAILWFIGLRSTGPWSERLPECQSAEAEEFARACPWLSPPASAEP